MSWNTDEVLIAKNFPEFTNLDPAFADQLLEVAHIMCKAYAPSLPAGTVPPANYLMAEALTARDLYKKSTGAGAENYGPEGLPIPVTDLTYVARTLLRPRTTPLSRFR